MSSTTTPNLPPSPNGTRVSQIVKIPVDQEVLLTERHVEFPEIHIREVVQPKVQLQEIIKEVVVPQPYWEDVYIEVPEVRVVESVVYVPQVKQVVVQVPKVEIHEVVKEVPKIEIVYEDEYVEIAKRVANDKYVEVEEIEEVIRIVPEIKIVEKEIEKVVQVPRIEVEYVEELREVPSGNKKVVNIPPKDKIKKKIQKEVDVENPEIVEVIIEKEVPNPDVEIIETVKQIPIPGDIIDRVQAIDGKEEVIRERVIQVPREEIFERVVMVKKEKKPLPPTHLVEYYDDLGNRLPVDTEGNPILLIEEEMLRAAHVEMKTDEYLSIPMKTFAGTTVGYGSPTMMGGLSSSEVSMGVPLPLLASPLPSPAPLMASPLPSSPILSSPLPLSHPLQYVNDPTVVIIEPIRGEFHVRRIQDSVMKAPPVFVYEDSSRVLPELIEKLPNKVVREMSPISPVSPILLTTAMKHEDGTLLPIQPVFENGLPPPGAIPLPFGAPIPSNAKLYLGEVVGDNQEAREYTPYPSYYSNLPPYPYPISAPLLYDNSLHNSQQIILPVVHQG